MPKTKELIVPTLEREVLKTLLYFNIFRYPLTNREILDNLSIKVTEDTLAPTLVSLIEKKIIHVENDFYFISGQKNIVSRRIKGNKLATQYLKHAHKVCSVVSKFPFIRGIYISGSLSKNYMHEKGDIDYFVITKPNRLWLAKGILAMTKKIFLFNSKKYFCFNYFIDSEHLEIPDKNLFTAKELYHLIPIYNAELFQKMLSSNKWAKDFLPNFRMEERTPPINVKKSTIKKSTEFILGGPLGNALDTLLMKIFEAYWQYKYKVKGDSDIRVRCHKHVSKIHPNNFQVKVLDALAKEEKALKQRFDFTFSN